jgi:hypothetical protein
MDFVVATGAWGPIVDLLITLICKVAAAWGGWLPFSGTVAAIVLNGLTRVVVVTTIIIISFLYAQVTSLWQSWFYWVPEWRTGTADAETEASSPSAAAAADSRCPEGGCLVISFGRGSLDWPLVGIVLCIVLSAISLALGCYWRRYRNRFMARFHAKLEQQKQKQFVHRCHLMSDDHKTSPTYVRSYSMNSGGDWEPSVYKRYNSKTAIRPTGSEAVPLGKRPVNGQFVVYDGPVEKLDQVPRSVRLMMGTSAGFALCILSALIFAAMAAILFIRRYLFAHFGEWVGALMIKGVQIYVFHTIASTIQEKGVSGLIFSLLSALGSYALKCSIGYLLKRSKEKKLATYETGHVPTTALLKRQLTPEIQRVASLRQRNERVVKGSARPGPSRLSKHEEEILRREQISRYREFSREYNEFAAREAEKAERIAAECRKSVLTGFAPSHVPSAATVQSSAAAAGGSAVGSTNATKLLPPGPPRFTRTASMIWRDKPASEVRTLGAVWERAATATASTGATAPPAQGPATPPPLHIPGGPPAPGPAASAPPTHLMHRD